MADKPNIPELTAEQARELLRYEPDTGKLYWLQRPRHLFSTARDCKAWNTKHAGKEAFANRNGSGYFNSPILGRMYRAHRVIWLIQTGSWPDGQIDHINRVRDDNRWSNLRVVTNKQNHWNLGLRATNSSGVNGVHWNKSCGKWHARIRVNGHTKHIGFFDTLEEAALARMDANVLYGFGTEHGLPPAKETAT